MKISPPADNLQLRSNWKAFLWAVFDIFCLILVSYYIYIGRDIVPFHADESTFIRMSLDYTYLVQEHNLSKVIYNEQRQNLDEQHQRIAIGAVTPLSIGLAWNLAGMRPDDINGFWTWSPKKTNLGAEWRWNIDRGNLPDPGLLKVARIPSTLFTILSIFVVFGIIQKLVHSRVAAWVTLLIYVTSPSILVNGLRAMQEGALLFFTSILIYIALCIIQEQRKPKYREGWLVFWYILAGIASGLALASKINSILILAAAFLALLFSPLYQTKIPTRKNISLLVKWTSLLIGSGFISLAVFICFMPVWWTFWFIIPFSVSLAVLSLTFGFTKSEWRIWIVRGVAVVVLLGTIMYTPRIWNSIQQPFRIITQERIRIAKIQATGAFSLNTPAERIITLVNELFFAKTQYYELGYWSSFSEIRDQIMVYENAHLNGRDDGVFLGVALIVLTALGCWALIQEWKGIQTLLVILWFLLPAVILLLTNPLPWQRYYIVLQIQLAVMTGLGFSFLTNHIAHFWRHGRTKASV
jgi:hypothetical protein